MVVLSGERWGWIWIADMKFCRRQKGLSLVVQMRSIGKRKRDWLVVVLVFSST